MLKQAVRVYIEPMGFKALKGISPLWRLTTAITWATAFTRVAMADDKYVDWITEISSLSAEFFCWADIFTGAGKPLKAIRTVLFWLFYQVSRQGTLRKWCFGKFRVNSQRQDQNLHEATRQVLCLKRQGRQGCVIILQPLHFAAKLRNPADQSPLYIYNLNLTVFSVNADLINIPDKG